MIDIIKMNAISNLGILESEFPDNPALAPLVFRLLCNRSFMAAIADISERFSDPEQTTIAALKKLSSSED